MLLDLFHNVSLCEQRSAHLLPRHFEYFANLRRLGDRSWIAANKHVLHGTRRDRIIVLRPNSYVAQSGRLPESFCELCDSRRGVPVLRPQGLCDDRLLSSIDGSIPAQNARQHYARAMSMRYVSDRSKLMTDAVAGTPINAAEPGRCEPNRELAVEPTRQIHRICAISRQRFGQHPQRMNAGSGGERLRLARANCLYRVVHGADARRKPQPRGGIQCSGGIQNDDLTSDQAPRVKVLYFAGRVRTAAEIGEFGS